MRRPTTLLFSSLFSSLFCSILPRGTYRGTSPATCASSSATTSTTPGPSFPPPSPTHGPQSAELLTFHEGTALPSSYEFEDDAASSLPNAYSTAPPRTHSVPRFSFSQSMPLPSGKGTRIPASAAAIALPDSFWGGWPAGSEAAEANHHQNHHAAALHIHLRPRYCPAPGLPPSQAAFHARCPYRAGLEPIRDLPSQLNASVRHLPVFSRTVGIGTFPQVPNQSNSSSAPHSSHTTRTFHRVWGGFRPSTPYPRPLSTPSTPPRPPPTPPASLRPSSVSHFPLVGASLAPITSAWALIALFRTFHLPARSSTPIFQSFREWNNVQPVHLFPRLPVLVVGSVAVVDGDSFLGNAETCLHILVSAVLRTHTRVFLHFLPRLLELFLSFSIFLPSLLADAFPACLPDVSGAPDGALLQTEA
ncbi:hypothetical protein K438DRAFT_1992827 [Mycena galopus ATCC 62051]|nr:hypothetical protein K438DRAFT_1992827 [Mycena galopus ATCC 62051]